MAYGIIYLWRDKARNMYYIGSHDGDIDDTYLSSSRWLNGEIQFRPADFRRRILKRIDIESIRLEEYRLIKMIKDQEFGKKYYNLKSGRPKGTVPWNKGKKDIYSEKTIEKMSLAKIGKSPPNKGIPNPSSADNARKGANKLSNLAKGRKRLYKEDGSWTWCYSVK